MSDQRIKERNHPFEQSMEFLIETKEKPELKPEPKIQKFYNKDMALGTPIKESPKGDRDDVDDGSINPPDVSMKDDQFDLSNVKQDEVI